MFVDHFDIAVIGGGASGLAAAAAAACEAEKNGLRLKIAVLEKNQRVGKKLLTTGSGRCNLTNMHADTGRYHGDAAAAAEIFDRFPPQKVIEAFRSMGLLCRELEEGRVYPYSLQASSVLNVLRRELERENVRIVCGFPVDRMEKAGGGFLLASGKSTVFAQRIVVATGGKACPQSGSDGGGFSLLRPFGHSTTVLHPALVQIKTEPKRVRPLKGVRCMAAAVLKSGGKVLASSRGEVQFAESALSGICIFELSRCVGEKTGQMEIALDLAPEFTDADLFDYLQKISRVSGGLPALQIPEGFLNKALGAEVVKTALNGDLKPADALTDEDVAKISRRVKDFVFPATGTMSWQNAQVTAGGIPLAEADSGLRSRFCDGIYLCGELLNIDGGCGGFNLHWAWASGFTAGAAAAKSFGEGKSC